MVDKSAAARPMGTLRQFLMISAVIVALLFASVVLADVYRAESNEGSAIDVAFTTWMALLLGSWAAFVSALVPDKRIKFSALADATFAKRTAIALVAIAVAQAIAAATMDMVDGSGRFVWFGFCYFVAFLVMRTGAAKAATN